MCPEADRVLELVLVVDPGELERAHPHAVRCDAEADAVPRKLVLAEELVERGRKRGDVAHLAGHDDAAGQWPACELEQPRGPVVGDTRRRELRGADLEPHNLAAQRLRCAALFDAPRSPYEVGELDLSL